MSLLCLVWVVLLLAPQVWAAGNEPVHMLPDPYDGTFRSRQKTYLQQELPSILTHYLSMPFVHTGALHATAPTCTSAPLALEGYTSAGNRVTSDGSGGGVAIAYDAANLAANCAPAGSDVCWVALSGAGQDLTLGAGGAVTRSVLSMPTLPGSALNRVGSSNLYVDCTSPTEPAVPDDALLVGKVTITNGAITGVEDLAHRRITQSLTISETLQMAGQLFWDGPGPLITVAQTKVLTLTRCPVAGRWQIFDADETTTGAVRFTAQACQEIYPEWWGGTAITDGVTNASPALQQAVNSLTSSAGRVRLGSGTYALTTAVALPNGTMTVAGVGWMTRVVGAADPLLALASTLPTTNGHQQIVEDLAIETTADNTGIRVHQVWQASVEPGFVLRRLYIRNMSETTATARGVSIRGVVTGAIQDCYFGSRPTYNHVTNLGGSGIYLDVADVDIATSVMNLLISNNFFVSLNVGIHVPTRTFLDPAPGRIEGIQIANNMFAALNYGIRMYRSLATSVINNNISDVNVGVELQGDFAAAITSNMITSCRVACLSYAAITEFAASDTTIVGNTLSPLHNPEGIGILLTNTTVDNYLATLTITGNTIASPVAGTGGGIAFVGDQIIAGVSITGNSLRNVLNGIAFLNTTPASEIVLSANTYLNVTVMVTNPAASGTLTAKSYAFTSVKELVGGATTEVVHFAIPADTFLAKPDACLIMSAVPSDSLLGWYDWANVTSTPTNVRVTLASNSEASNIDAGSHRFNVACFGAGYLLR